MNSSPAINVISLGTQFNITFGAWSPQNNATIALHYPGNWVSYEVVDDGEWHFYSIASLDGTSANINFYQDGSLLTNQSSDGNYNYTSQNSKFYFGKPFILGDGNMFNGSLDNIQIWNTALSSSEIQQYMSSPPTGNEAGLVGYWNFNEGSGSTVTDLSGNGNNGTINGASWSSDAPSQYANNCTATDDIVVTVNPQEDATFTYPNSSYCADDSDPSPTISGTSGGTFTANSAGLNIVAATGLIDLDASTPGTYTITYTTPGANCSATSTQNVTIKDPPIISAGADQTVCAGSDVTLTGSGAVTYIWDNGVIDGEPFTPPSTANYVLTATEPFGTIATIGNQFETSNGTSGNFQGQSFTTGSSNALLLSITTNAIGGSSGAQLANGIAGSILNIRTYVNDVETGTNHAVTGTILATASNPSILNTNYQAPSSKFIFDSTLTLTANTRYVIEFVSGSGVGIYSRLHSVSSGNDEYTGGQAYDIDGFNQSFVRDYPFLITTLENTNISGPNGCSATDMVTVTVNPQEDATFAYSGSSYCADDSDPNPVNPTPIISGTTGGVFSSTAGLSINSSTGQVDLDASTPGTYTITYSTPGANCSATSTQDVTITTSSTDFNYGGDTEFCLGTTNPVATITGASGGTFSATGGLTIDASTGQIDLSTAIAGNYQVTYTSASSGNFQQIGQDIDGEAAGDESGRSVSMNAAGDRLAIGARNNDGNGSNAGHVRIYDWNGTAWTQLGADIDGEAADDRSGYSVSMNAAGDRVAIGAYGNDGNGISGAGSGHVRIYDWNGTAWLQLGNDIDGEGGGDASGHSVSMNAAGDRLAIGAWSNDGNGSSAGHVRIYDWNGTAWTQLGADIDGEAASDQSGYSVSMNAAGDRLAIGARTNDGNGSNAGHVRIYDWNGTAWIQIGADIDGEAANDLSGSSVSMNAAGDRSAIGAYGNDGNGTLAGHVRIFNSPTSTACPQPLNITIHSAPNLNLGDDTLLICDNSSQTLDAGTGFASYLWNDGSTNQTLLVSNSATYTVTGTDANGCTAQDSVHLDLLVGEIVQSDTTICDGDSLLFDASYVDADGFHISNTVINFSRDRKDVAVIIKPHPSADLSNLNELLSNANDNIYTVNKNILPDHALNVSDLMICKNTYMGIEAMIYDVQVVSVLLDKESIFKIFGKAAEYIYEKKELNIFLEKNLSSKDRFIEWKSLYKEKRRQFIQEYYSKAERSSEEIIVKTITKYIKKGIN